MSEIDIVLLGMIKKKPQSAYDLQKAVDYRNISYWIKISNPSIYKNVKRLEQNGYIVGEPSKSGNMAEKNIYSVTESGCQFLEKEMLALSNKEVRLFQGMNAVLLHLDLLTYEQRRECMTNISVQIGMLKSHIEQQMRERENVQIPISGQMIIEQQRELINVMSNWIQKYSKIFS